MLWACAFLVFLVGALVICEAWCDVGVWKAGGGALNEVELTGVEKIMRVRLC
jgi:hypothetical protein